MKTVWACVVCWRAPVEQVRALVDAIRDQVDEVLLLDNAAGADRALSQLVDDNVRYIAMPANLGTGGAMNCAWRLALASGVDAMASFDQDSMPAPDMVERLCGTLASLRRQGVRAAAVGPVKIDPRTGLAGRLLRPIRFLRRHAPGTAPGPVEMDHLITSGCLIAADAFVDVGEYDEGLFLDYVDMDWCVRARARGWRHYVDTAASLSHRIGDDVYRMGGRMLSIHQPMRNYLLLRNHLLLWKKPAFPRGWLASDFLQVAKKLAASLLLGAQRTQRLRWIAKAWRDGLRGRSGPPP
ncbi:glycosyltransferase family 2 protein [Ramlibacter sp.]|uniref:glycosyltransferase family 2 protein n=1 Tax=Ramlibacter sp. TaxID=1917967 RepID=UPI003D0F718F